MLAIKCKKCGEMKSINSFAKRKELKSGHDGACKECWNDRRRVLNRSKQSIFHGRKLVIKKTHKTKQQQLIVKYGEDVARILVEDKHQIDDVFRELNGY